MLFVKKIHDNIIISKRSELGKEKNIYLTVEDAKELRDQLDDIIDEIALDLEKTE